MQSIRLTKMISVAAKKNASSQIRMMSNSNKRREEFEKMVGAGSNDSWGAVRDKHAKNSLYQNFEPQSAQGQWKKLYRDEGNNMSNQQGWRRNDRDQDYSNNNNNYRNQNQDYSQNNNMENFRNQRDSNSSSWRDDQYKNSNDSYKYSNNDSSSYSRDSRDFRNSDQQNQWSQNQNQNNQNGWRDDQYKNSNSNQNNKWREDSYNYRDNQYNDKNSMMNDQSDWKLNSYQNKNKNQSDFSTSNRSKGSWGSGLGSSWESFNRDTHNEKQEGWPEQETFEQNAQRLYGGKSNSGSYKNYSNQNQDSLKQNDDFDAESRTQDNFGAMERRDQNNNNREFNQHKDSAQRWNSGWSGNYNN